MNNTFGKLTVVALACIALCATTFAAPRGGNGRGNAPKHAPKYQAHKPARAPKHRAYKPHKAPKPHKTHRHHRPLLIVRCCRYQHNVYDCLCCLPAQRITIWR